VLEVYPDLDKSLNCSRCSAAAELEGGRRKTT
jgi:hypothetical protein